MWFRLSISKNIILPFALILPNYDISPVCCLVWEYTVLFNNISTLSENSSFSAWLLLIILYKTLDSPSTTLYNVYPAFISIYICSGVSGFPIQVNEKFIWFYFIYLIALFFTHLAAIIFLLYAFNAS